MGAMAAELLRYHAWANARLIGFCAEQPDAELDATAPATYGTIRSTLAHLVGAEGAFLVALTGEQPDPPLSPGDPAPPFDDLLGRAERSGAALQAAASRLAPDHVVRMRRRGAEIEIAASAILAQAVYHAGEHRAQVVAILDQRGIRPPDLSGWAFGGDRSRDYA
jgi:uncharacterized damage-inducible protein DinB